MKIKSILIANRGEIAIRIAKTAKVLGIKTYVIKTNKEPNALYHKHADEVIDCTDHDSETPEFLDIDLLIGMAKDKKISAVHPGYGFLAESPEFAERCEKEGIIFIGPSSEAIYKMGHKIIAKQIATEHKIPLLGGSDGNVKDVKEALEIADKIGYPVIIKASAGGGGRGMRIVEKASQMENMFKMATNEAEKAFKNASVFVEKYVKNPRHIEFQIIADKQGNIVHLGERECSIQRKHQKLIEESPSAALDDKLRSEMGDAAVRMAKAVNYYSAGTVEFLLDSDKKFYFMEMNTRIQVEHPVTEAITGVDLIEMMIKIAEGDKLPFKQEDIVLDGWAFEFRINAEDVQANFSPNLGIVEKIVFPKGKYIRIDTGVEDCSVITPYYDSMIAKLIIWGESRDKAINSAIAALRKIRIRGIKTTIPFHKAVLFNKAFKKGSFNTSFIGKELKKMHYQEEEEEMLAAYFATLDYTIEIQQDKDLVLDYEKGKHIDPWLLNKRMKSL